MASKNHKRYKLRKKMNSIKHVPEPLFSEPPVLIKGWEDLVGLENEKYAIDVELDGGCGWIRPKFEVADNDPDYYHHNMYLSTHTFYERHYFHTTAILRNMGFNIQLENWDGKTVYCRR